MGYMLFINEWMKQKKTTNEIINGYDKERKKMWCDMMTNEIRKWKERYGHNNSEYIDNKRFTEKENYSILS